MAVTLRLLFLKKSTVMKKFLIFFCSFLAIIIFWPVIQNLLQGEEQPIRIAFIGPMSGYMSEEGKTAGQVMTRAVQLYLDEVNKSGGINGKKVELETFDDQNHCTGDKAKAKEEALNIVRDNRFVAVIGHWYSGCSITGGKIYKKYGIPAITPGSLKKEVTYGNNWYFRNIYNASASGQFLAYYVNKVFGLNQVSIIHDNTGYGAYLADEFKKSATQLGMEIKNQWNFHNHENMNSDIENIVNQLKENAQEAGAILLATQAYEGVALVKLIKDKNIQNHIISGAGFSEQAFKNGFDKFPREKANPGYYTNDIYVTTPLLFEAANEKAQQFREKYQAVYDQEPDWSAAYAYDTAMVLVKAIKKARITGTQESIATDRQKIRQTLAGFTNIHEAVEGTTGFNYFDDNGDAQKWPMIGVYKNKVLISTFTQSQVIRSLNDVPNFEKAIVEEKRVWRIGDKYMYKTNVVYTGAKIKEISEVDMNNLTYKLDFHLWFRFQGDFNPQDIEFINAVEPEKLKTQLDKPVDEIQKGQTIYRLYHIEGRFKADFLSRDYKFGDHVLGVHFHHRYLNSNNLIYVNDSIGMRGADGKFAQILSPTSGWQIKQFRFFRDIHRKSSLGHPDYLSVQEGIVKHSLLNIEVWVDEVIGK